MGSGVSPVGGRVVDLGDGNIYEANKYFGKEPPSGGMYGSWNDSISDSQRDALKTYTGSAFWKINENLRGGGDPTPEDKQRDAAIEKFVLKDDIKVYRGSGSALLNGYSTPEEINANLKGGTVIDKGYVSTSTSKSGKFDGITYEITVRKGRGKGAFVAPISKYSSESEFTLKRGTSFKVKGAKYGRSGETVVMLEC